jgi:hypothetical protein
MAPVRSRFLAGATAVAAAVPALAAFGFQASAQTPGGWHVFVYIVNDSEGQLPYGQDIDEMLEASRSGIDFTVYLDSSEAAGPRMTTTMVPNTGDALLIEIADGAVEVTQRLGELDSGAPETLAWFLAQGMVAHPSDQAALVVWDHGAGWNGIAIDEDVSATGSRRMSALDSTDIATALSTGLDAAGRDRLDLVVFDACLMASLDTLKAASQGRVDYMIASEEVIPGLGLDYNGFAALAQPAVTPEAYFATIADTYVTEVAEAQPSDAQGFTLSMFDVTQSGAIENAVAAFAAAAAVDVRANPQPYLQAAAGLHKYGVSGESWFGFLDLGEYLNALTGISADVSAARDQVLAAITAARIGQRNGAPQFDGATGLTVYFPLEPREFNPNFERIASSGVWMPFLSAYHDAQAGVVLQTDVGFAAESLTIGPSSDPNYLTISVPVTASFTGSVELLAATTDAAGVRTFFESDSGQLVDGVATAQIYPTLTTVSDGTRSVVPYTRYVQQSDGWHGYSTFTLRRANGSIAQLNWDRVADQGPFTVVDGNGIVTSYTPQAGDLAYPISYVQQADGVPLGVPTDVALDPNRLWTVTDQALPAGTEVYLELRLLDANGSVIDTVTGATVVAS